MTDEKPSSEFGKGLTYCLGLFLCHTERYIECEPNDRVQRLMLPRWFNGASDHLYELEAESCPDEIRDKVYILKNFAFRLRRSDCTEADIALAKKMALEILRMIDEKMLGIDVIEGDYE